MKLKDKSDLTRWNRAGLSEFRYIDGNATTYLETLRQQLVEAFDVNGAPSWSELVTRHPELPDETRRQTRQRLLDQYHDERRDYAWEILRSLARSAHVLGEYVDAYANEAYLPTAVEWDNIRRLVGMLGYRPAPPASAATHIALLLKDGESGEVDKGFAVKNKPVDGAPTAVFETLEKLSGSSALNLLHLKDWNRNPALIGNAIVFPLAQAPDDISVGDLGVLATGDKGLPVKVTKVNAESDTPALLLQALSGAPDSSFRYHNCKLFLQPRFIESPLANGANSARLGKDSALNVDEIVFGKDSKWWVARIERNAFGHVDFKDLSKVLKQGAKLYQARSLKRQANHFGGSGYVYVFPQGDNGVKGILVDEDLTPLAKPVIQERHIKDESNKVVETTYYISGNHGEQIYYPADEAVTDLQAVGLKEIRFSGKAKGLETGDWTLVTDQAGNQSACSIKSIDQQEDWFELDLKGLGGAVSLLRTDFKLTLQARDHDVNGQPAWHSSSTDSVTVVELESAPDAELKPGRKLICAGDDFAVAVELKEVVTGTTIRLHLAPPFHLDPEAAGLTRHACALYANVAAAGHGESQPEKILGNGDATQTGQCFALPPERVTWVADAGFASGVRADLQLRVGQRIWQQVENLKQSSPEDAHYQVQVDQDGALSVCFGDGRNGRRLPTGIDNVRVRYRTGYGEEGNLEPFALEKIAKPHRLVEDFIAPLASAGGAEKESADSMRESAPATVLALERAVSLDDFTHLASHHSMVWQARAFEKMPDRPARPLVEVVVVAAGGATFMPGSETAQLIAAYLQAHAAPDTPVSVISYVPVLLDLKVSIMVDEAAFDKKQVQQAVRDKLVEGLALQQRQLGQPLFRSEVIALIEQVTGVENGHCEILETPYPSMPQEQRPRLHKAEDGGVRRVSVKPHQLLYLDATAYEPDISSRQYEI